MNPYLLLSAAALLAGTSGAVAGKRVTTVSFDGYCDELKIVEPQRGVFAVQYTNCGGPITTGQGLARKGDQGRFVELSDNYEGNYRSIGLSYDLSLPLRTGGTWALWLDFSGTTSFEANSGTYTANAVPRSPDGARLMDRVKVMIAARRLARASK